MLLCTVNGIDIDVVPKNMNKHNKQIKQNHNDNNININ